MEHFKNLKNLIKRHFFKNGAGRLKFRPPKKVIFFEQKLFFRNLGLNLVKKNAFYKIFSTTWVTSRVSKSGTFFNG